MNLSKKIFFTLTLLSICSLGININSVYAVCNPSCVDPKVCDEDTSTCVDTTSEDGGGNSNSETPVQDGLGEFLGVNPGIRTEGTLIGYIAQIIRWALGLVGTVFFGLVLMSGFNYMTAGDDSNKAKQSLSSISNATIGLVLMIGAFLITNYVISAVLAV